MEAESQSGTRPLLSATHRAVLEVKEGSLSRRSYHLLEHVFIREKEVPETLSE